MTPTGRRSIGARKAVARARGGRSGGWVWIAVGVIAVALTAVLIVAKSPRSQQNQAVPPQLRNPPATTAVGRETLPPWSAPSDAAAAARAAGLPLLSREGTVEHIHAHLDVSVDGRSVEVPAMIGIDRRGISPVHTHDATGVIHIESPVNRTFTLGEFFTEWDVTLSADGIGGLRTGDGKTLRAFVNGNPVTGNPAGLPINAHDEIVVIYGTAQPGPSVPAHYDFAAGL
ncbi:hypothetical protein [Mycobacterium sp. E3198]|uniref:hypothetical protein n=1 Tax=Mycobacterium sp. E3198 TaxID=1834143 RepID=UPI0007FEF895|nr:hypothetical protein [Mycobacterium sp. E3198]OBG38716.1 hypothetical protein A5673_14230 [Mycobacterium sp. E3198]